MERKNPLPQQESEPHVEGNKSPAPTSIVDDATNTTEDDSALRDLLYPQSLEVPFNIFCKHAVILLITLFVFDAFLFIYQLKNIHL